MYTPQSIQFKKLYAGRDGLNFQSGSQLQQILRSTRLKLLVSELVN